MMLLMVALLFAGAQTLSAQRTITGTVISADDNMTVPGASVSVRGTTIGTMTDINGRFSLNVPADATHLVFSFMGMETQEIAIGGATVIDARLTSGAIGLDEFVVVGFGSARRVGNVVGSISQVTSESLEARPVANVMDALQGQVAGLAVFSSSGEPGSTPTVRLHGVGSLGAGSAPLWIVDGIPVETGAVQAMNPNDFESVTVLRDASATSIFGARAANGVVVITTKRGVRGDDARITVRHQFGVSQLAERRFFNNLMSASELEAFYIETNLRTPEFFENIRRDFGTHNTNWLDVYMRDNVPTFQTDVSIRGGGGRTTYFISGNHFSQQGTAHGSYFERFTGRINVDSEANSWLRVGMNTHFSRDHRRSNANWGGNFLSGGLSALIEPWFSSEEVDGRLPGTGGSRAGLIHPRHLAEYTPSGVTNSQLTGSVFAELSLMEGLRIITRAGTNARDWTSIGGMLPTRVDRINHPDRGTKSVLNEQLITMHINNVIEYSFRLGDAHNITALLGQEGQTNTIRSMSASTAVIEDARLWNLQHGDPERTTASESETGWTLLSFFGNVTYNYNERFFGEFTLRNDASSRFGANNRNAWFWAVGGMWRLTNEPFIRDIALITDARINVSYGTQGNAEIGNFSHLGLVGSRAAMSNQYMGTPSWMVTTVGNPDLRWEQQDRFTVGLHTELMHRFDVSVEFYHRRTRDMLMAVPQPGTSGFGSIMSNVGSMRNRGVDITLGAEIFRTRDWHVGASGVFNYNREKIIELFDGQDQWIVPGTLVGHMVGHPVMFVMPIWGGVDPNNGRQWWYLPGEDMAVTATDPNRTTQLFDEDGLMQNTGFRRNAPINGGFGLNGGWRGIQVVADFAFTLGKWMVCNTSFFTMNPNRFDGFNQVADVNDFWRNPGDDTRFPDWRQGQEMQFDTHLLSNASFMRLRNLTVSYNFDRSLLARTGFIRNARVFATGRNLFTVTNFKGIDPEVDSNIALGTYTNSRQFQIGLELGF